jgi:hypothetical protein
MNRWGCQDLSFELVQIIQQCHHVKWTRCSSHQKLFWELRPIDIWLRILNQPLISAISSRLCRVSPNIWCIWNEDEIVKMLVLIALIRQIQRWSLYRHFNDETSTMIGNQKDGIIFMSKMELFHHSILIFIITIFSSECFEMTSVYCIPVLLLPFSFPRSKLSGICFEF